MGENVKHTPGPWTFGFESVDPEWAVVTIKGGLVVANVNADHRQNANARLISAAPDLFEALKAALPFIEEGFRGFGDPDREGHALELMLAAIAKAEGSQ